MRKRQKCHIFATLSVRVYEAVGYLSFDRITSMEAYSRAAGVSVVTNMEVTDSAAIVIPYVLEILVLHAVETIQTSLCTQV